MFLIAVRISLPNTFVETKTFKHHMFHCFVFVAMTSNQITHALGTFCKFIQLYIFLFVVCTNTTFTNKYGGEMKDSCMRENGSNQEIMWFHAYRRKRRLIVSMFWIFCSFMSSFLSSFLAFSTLPIMFVFCSWFAQMPLLLNKTGIENGREAMWKKSQLRWDSMNEWESTNKKYAQREGRKCNGEKE